MPAPDLDGVVSQIYTILTSDARTSGIAWYKGRQTLHDVESFPAGAIALVSGRAQGASVPSGLGTVAEIVIQVRYVSSGGASEAELAMQQGLENVIAVLWDNRNLNHPQVGWFNFEWRATSAPEAEPPYADAVITLSVTMRS
jgi:hypothetical protein